MNISKRTSNVLFEIQTDRTHIVQHTPKRCTPKRFNNCILLAKQYSIRKGMYSSDLVDI